MQARLARRVAALRRVRAAIVVAAALLLPAAAGAHLGNLGYVDFDVRGSEVAMRFRYAAHVTPGWPAGEGGKPSRAQVLGLEGSIEQWLARTVSVQGGGGPCLVDVDNVVGPDRNDDLEVTGAWACPGEIAGLRIAFAALGDSLDEWQTVASMRLGGKSSGTVFTPAATRWIVGEDVRPPGERHDALDADADASAWSTTKRFFALGVEHIWTGYDHLLFLLAVLLAGGGIVRLAAIVTSFTVAHSVTLGAAATGLVALPVEPVEAAIALSIVYVAAENILGRGADRRALVTFAFGLVHGFGFASVLAETALPPSEVLLPLLAFNLGVEAGQLAVVVAVVPFLAVVLRGPHGPRVRVAVSAVVALAGAAWAIERIGVML